MGGGIWVRPGPPSDLIRVWMVQGDGWCRRPAGVVGLDGPWGRGVLRLGPLGGPGWSLGTGCVRVQPQKGPRGMGVGAVAVAAFNFVAIRGDGLGCIPWVSTRSHAASAATP